MSILTTNADWFHELMMSLVHYLVDGKVFALDMNKPVRNVKTEIIAHHQNEHLLAETQRAWHCLSVTVFHKFEVEVGKVAIEVEGTGRCNQVVEKHYLDAVDYFSLPSHRVHFPGPWFCFFNFVLLKEREFCSVNEIVNTVEGDERWDLEDAVEIHAHECFGHSVSVWQQKAIR